MRKPLLLLLFLCLLPVLAFAETSENLLVNGDFSQLDSSGKPVGWYTGAWFTNEGITVFGSDAGREGEGHSVSIHNIGLNDARYLQTVKVEPESLYCLSGYIRAEEIAAEGWGANLSIDGLYVSTSGLFDTYGRWEYVTLYGETGENQRELTVFVRVGGYSGESRGKAWFDDISLRKIDRLPDDVIAARWYRQETVIQKNDDDGFLWDDEYEEEASPFWPWLLVIGVGYSLLAMLCLSFLRQVPDQRTLIRREKPWLLIVALLLSAIVHFFLSCRITGYQVDINCFLSWGNTIFSVGPGKFYQTTNFCDYPPAYMLVLYVNEALIRLLRGWGLFSGILNEAAVLKLIPSLCDLGIVCLLYRLAKKLGLTERQAGVIALIAALNPVLLINSAAWGQVDSALAILLLLLVVFALSGDWHLVMPCYMLAVLVKPQALMLGFLGLIAIILGWIRGDRTVRRRMLFGLLWTALVALIIILPFSIGNEPGWLIQKYADTLSSYPYATVNTANLYYLFSLNWTSITEICQIGPAAVLALVALFFGLISSEMLWKKKAPLFWLEGGTQIVFAVFFLIYGFMGTTWTVLGYGAIAFAVVGTAMLYIRSQKIETLPLLGYLLFLLLYVLGIKMHERYLFPAIPLLTLALTLTKDARLLVLLVFSSFTMFVNEGIVLDNSIRLGSAMGHLNNDTQWLANILSILNIMQVPFALWTCCDLCIAENRLDLSGIRRLIPARKAHARSPRDFKPDASLHWTRVDTILIFLITSAYAFVGFFNLGSHKAPETAWTSTVPEESVILDLGEVREDFSMLYYCQVSYDNFSVAVSDDAENWSREYFAEMDQGQCFRWKYLMPGSESNGKVTFSGGNTYHAVQKLTGRYVRITGRQIGLRLNEVIFRESVYGTREDGSTIVFSGSTLPVTVYAWSDAKKDSPLYSDPQHLIDEQDSLEGEPGWYNGTYFDEIYHARTAYEHYTGGATYETTHPPLGKVIMSWSVAVFGMNPFGWRFAGALVGVLMVPVLYLLGKQLTKRTGIAIVSALLISLDTMHFTQTRIATIDSFPVFFILLAYFFMLRFMQRDLSLMPIRRLLPDLALSGFFMGCAVASKWIGIYAGFGLAVLFFWTLARHVCMSLESQQLLNSLTAKKKAASDEDAEEAEDDASETPDPENLTARARLPLRRCVYLCLWCLLFFVAVPIAIYLLSYIPYFRYQNPQSFGDFLRLVWKAQEGMLDYHSTPGLGMDHPFYSPWYEWPIIAKPMYYASAAYTSPGKSYSIFCFGNPAIWWTALLGFTVTLCVFVYRHHYDDGLSDSTLHLRSTSWSVNPAFVLLGFLAQFLPWVLVPRGTYIYHYFASVPFLILTLALSLNWLSDLFPKISQVIMIVYPCVCLAFFIILFPYASGIEANYGWLDFGEKFLHLYYSMPVG